MPYTVDDLSAVLDRVPPTSRSFATDLIRKASRGLSDKQLFWVNKLTEQARNPMPALAPIAIGSMNGIIELFDRAKAHLKFPAIILSCTSETLRITVAGPSAKFPGSVNVTSQERYDDRRRWFGRVHRDGRYEPSAKAEASAMVIAARLIEFALNPARVAAEHGRLTGRCCFCNLPLSDERSTNVGYGKICAKRYGLTWGS
jgi:hypothetical protein